MAEAPSLIKLLVPDMPTAAELAPYLERMDRAEWYSNNGPLVRELEETLRLRIGAPSLVVANATVALELTLRALRLPRGSRVLVPAMTFTASGQAIWNAQLQPVLCDVDPTTWQMTPETAAAGSGGSDIRAAMPVASFGMPVPLDGWEVFSRENRIPVVIDAAAALMTQGASRFNRVTSVYSLHATKFIGAGEGGAIASHDSFMLNQIRKLSTFGPWGTNAKMSEYHAAVALASLDRLTEKRARMQPLADAYNRHFLGALSTVRINQTVRYDTTTLCALLPDHMNATDTIADLAVEHIESKQWYRPFLDEQTQFQSCFRPYAGLPVTDQIRARMVGLPFHHRMTVADVDDVCETLADLIET